MARFELCNVCEAPGSLIGSSDKTSVHSNVRAFRNESFAVWRCQNCRSIHAQDDVDLNHYYSGYPFQRQKMDLFRRLASRNYLRRLERTGVRPADSVLDYGCGSGLLIEYFRRRGYHDVSGFDEYSPLFGDRTVLNRPYDCLIMQDVIEHVSDPRSLMRTAISLTKPGGRICIGTPNATALNLREPDDFLHQLHQPYHRHILSPMALRGLAAEFGLSVLAWHDIYYCDLFAPFANQRYALFYAKLFDNTLDLAFEPIRFKLGMFTPRGIALGLLGRLVPLKQEMMVILRNDSA